MYDQLIGPWINGHKGFSAQNAVDLREEMYKVGACPSRADMVYFL